MAVDVVVFPAMTVGAEIQRGVTNAYLRLFGGTLAAGGANVLIYGTTHATNPNELHLNASGGIKVPGAVSLDSSAAAIAAGTYSLRILAAGGADRDLVIAAVNGVSNGFGVRYVSGTMRYSFANIPTSATGLAGGEIWSDSGTLKIV